VSSLGSASKANQSAERKRLRNRSVRSEIKTYTRKAEGLISAGELDSARQGVVAAVSSIDKAVSKGVIHKNKGARLKSRLVRKLNAVPERSEG